MTEDEMRAGFAQGRRLYQEEGSTQEEVEALDRLAAEGLCSLTDWAWHDSLQREVRWAVGKKKEQDNGRT